MTMPLLSSEASTGEGPLVENVLFRCVRPVVLRFLAATWICAGVCGVLIWDTTPTAPAGRWPFYLLYGYVCVAVPALGAWFVMERLWKRLPKSRAALGLVPAASAPLGFLVGACVDIGDSLAERALWGLVGATCAVLATLVNHVFFRPLPVSALRTLRPVGPQTRSAVRIIIGLAILASVLLTLVSCAGYIFFFSGAPRYVW